MDQIQLNSVSFKLAYFLALMAMPLIIVWVLLTRNLSWIALPMLLFAYFAVFFGTLSVTAGRPKKWANLAAWATPRQVVVALLASWGALTGVINFIPYFDPQGSTERVPGITDRNAEIAAKYGKENSERLARLENVSGEKASIRQKIVGVWGEVPNCAVVSYRFAVNGDALSIKSERRPKNTIDYGETAHIETAKDSELTSSAVVDGQWASFRFETIADTDWLIWTTRGERPSPLRLMRCDQ